MTPENMKKVVDLCNQVSNITYENLTKIIRLEQTGSATGARKLDDSDQNDIDSWMGGGTCFSMTWHLYQTLTDMGFKPRLVMGHKRKEHNIHCALILPDPDSNVTLEAHSADRAHNGSYRSLHSLQNAPPKFCRLFERFFEVADCFFSSSKIVIVNLIMKLFIMLG